MTATPLLDVRRLGRDYGSAGLFHRRSLLTALDEVSFTVAPGEIFGIVGESGSGKSTLARLVTALDRPTRGTVVFDGDDLFALSRDDLTRRRASFQMVFQDPYGSLDPRHRIGWTVAEPLHVLGHRPGRRETRDRVVEILESVGLTAEALDRYPHEFSGGQRQRIAIARALVTSPKLVVADEPVSALDLSVQAQVLNLLLDLRDRRGITFLFVSHDLAVVDCIADRVGVVLLGRLIEVGPARAVFDRPLHPYTRLLVEAAPSLHAPERPSRRRIPPAATPTGPGCPFAARCDLVSERCRAERPALRPLDDGRSVACHDVG